MGGMTTTPKNSKRIDSAPVQPRLSGREVVSFVPLPSWIKAAARCGFAIDPVLREIGVSIDDHGLHEVSITLEQSRQLIEACVARARGEHFPFVFGEIFAFDSMPEIETFVATCATLRDALRVFDWVRTLMSSKLRVTLHESGNLAQLRIDMGKDTSWLGPTVYFTEAWLASMLKLIRSLLGPQQVERLLVRHAAPPYADAYERFFATEVRFGQPYDAIVLRRDLLDRPLHGAFPELHRQAEARIEQRISQLSSRAGLAGQLERIFLDHPALLALGIEESAVILGLHVRTLQRRLQEEGENFAELQARLRFRLACLLLRETALDLETISERLGFSERRAFTRAFTRWAGRSPSAFRQSPDKDPSA